MTKITTRRSIHIEDGVTDSDRLYILLESTHRYGAYNDTITIDTKDIDIIIDALVEASNNLSKTDRNVTK